MSIVKYFLAFVFLLALNACTSNVDEAISKEEQAITSSLKEKCENDECPCESPIGTISHGSQVAIYDVETVSCEQSCQAQQKTLKCNNGQLIPSELSGDQADPDLDYAEGKFYSCRAEKCQPCVHGGSLIQHRETVELYNTEVVDCNLSCEDAKTTRQCINGILNGDTNYSKTNCQVRECRCRLPDESGFLTLNGNMDFYSKEKANCGSSCEAIKLNRVCQSAGVGADRIFSFSGSNTFKFQACMEPTNCFCTLPNGLGVLNHNETTKLSNSATVACGQTCADDASETLVKCTDGVLKVAADDQVIDVATTPLRFRCKVDECVNCRIPGYGSLVDGQDPVILYTKSIYNCGEKIEMFQYEFRCENEQLLRNGSVYDAVADPNRPSRYYNSIYNNCRGCRTPWGVRVNEGAKVMAYQLVGATGGSACGKGCKKQEQLCKDGVLIGDSSYNKQRCDNLCAEEGGGAPPRMCLLPWQNSFVTPGAKVPMWKKATVPCGQSCQSHFKLATCQLETGTFDVGHEYIHKSCTELCF